MSRYCTLGKVEVNITHCSQVGGGGGAWLVQHSALVASSYDIAAPSVRAQIFWQLHYMLLTKSAQGRGIAPLIHNLGRRWR